MNKKLENSVIRQLGLTRKDADLIPTLNDIVNHGIGGGFSGFIYYTETIRFFKKNRTVIVDLVREMAQDFGQNPVDMVAGFNCLTDDFETREEIARALYGRLRSDDTQVANALAWFAAEEVARSIVEA